MNLIELMLQTVTAFIGGRVGPTTLIELGATENGRHMAWIRRRDFVVLVELIARNNPDAAHANS